MPKTLCSESYLHLQFVKELMKKLQAFCSPSLLDYLLIFKRCSGSSTVRIFCMAWMNLSPGWETAQSLMTNISACWCYLALLTLNREKDLIWIGCVCVVCGGFDCWIACSKIASGPEATVVGNCPLLYSACSPTIWMQNLRTGKGSLCGNSTIGISYEEGCKEQKRHGIVCQRWLGLFCCLPKI